MAFESLEEEIAVEFAEAATLGDRYRAVALAVDSNARLAVERARKPLSLKRTLRAALLDLLSGL